jgi:hypothetical protein
MNSSLKKQASRFAGLPGFFVCLTAILLLTCGRANDHEEIRKKGMPDLHYAYSDSDSAMQNIYESIARTMELYALNPQVFGDPLGVITAFSDSSNFSPAGRQTALIVTDANWQPPPGISKETISGGNALVYDCYRQLDSLDACWKEIADFASRYGYVCIPPGIEIYEVFGIESEADSSMTRLIIRLR